MLFDVCRPKGKPPVGGVSIFGAVTDELMDGTTSTEPESSSVTAAPAKAATKPVASSVSCNYLKHLYLCNYKINLYAWLIPNDPGVKTHLVGRIQ